MSGEVAVQSALEPYAQRPSLPDGWFLARWTITLNQRYYPDGNEVEIDCMVVHPESGVHSDLFVRFRYGQPPSLDWLPAYLNGLLGIPRNVDVRATREDRRGFP